jgi:hypothetical protein
MLAVMLLRAAGSSHRAFVAAEIRARFSGLAIAALSRAPLTGSSHRAFVAARCLSRWVGSNPPPPN